MKAFVRQERRSPIPRDRFRAAARHTGVRARLRRPLVLIDAALLALALVFVLTASPWVAGAFGSGVAQFGTKVGELFPTGEGTKIIDLPSGGGTVTADPTAQNLPDFTKEPALTLNGRVPSFALVEGRTVEVALNGAVVATVTPDAGGAFTVALTLRDGPNAVALTLLDEKEVVARSSYTVVLDRQAPTLTVTRPAPNDVVDGPNVVVSGKAEAGATVIINDRTVVPAQDGSFTDTFTAGPGGMTLAVTARDRAGNETTVKTPITVRSNATVAPLTVGVTLDNTRVKPGQSVLATITVTANGVPKSGELVTLSVGVITIGTATTDATGVARIGFAAPPNEGDASVVVLANGAAGRATLTVAK
jgi:hypothetical protein